MKPIFSRGPSLQLRLFLAVMIAIAVIVADSRLSSFVQIRAYMDTAVSPFYFLANGPRKMLDTISQTLASREQLALENHALRQELLLKNSEQLLLGTVPAGKCPSARVAWFPAAPGRAKDGNAGYLHQYRPLQRSGGDR